MKLYIRIAVCLATSCISGAIRAAVDVSPPYKREAAVNDAKAFTKRPDPSNKDLPDSLNNPFRLANTSLGKVEGKNRSRPASDRELLAILAEQIVPSGTFVLGGEPILLLGQKKMKVADMLPISFEGVTYNIELIAVERTTFTVRLNNETLTRPIK